MHKQTHTSFVDGVLYLVLYYLIWLGSALQHSEALVLMRLRDIEWVDCGD
jgi:hypothetical protein